MKISCIIVDDEPLARKGLQSYVELIEFLDLKAVCKNALEAMTLIKEQNIDLLFLDIEMPRLTGFELLNTLKDSPLVIFTTAYPNYALEGYKYEAIDYLVKPISFERFLQAANKAQRIISKTKSKTDNENESIFIKVDTQLVKVNVDDILYVEGMQNYISIQTTNDKLLTLVPLKNIFEMLSKDKFLQVHKSYVVAKNKVEKIEGNLIRIGDYSIPISTRMKKEVLKELTGQKVLKK